jgi:hypothetical protein
MWTTNCSLKRRLELLFCFKRFRTSSLNSRRDICLKYYQQMLEKRVIKLYLILNLVLKTCGTCAKSDIQWFCAWAQHKEHTKYSFEVRLSRNLTFFWSIATQCCSCGSCRFEFCEELSSAPTNQLVIFRLLSLHFFSLLLIIILLTNSDFLTKIAIIYRENNFENYILFQIKIIFVRIYSCFLLRLSIY